MSEGSHYTIQQKDTSKHIVRLKKTKDQHSSCNLEHTAFEAAWEGGVARLVAIAAEKIGRTEPEVCL